MARRRKRSPATEGRTPMMPSTRAQVGAVSADVVAGNVGSNHDYNVLGVSNARRYFDLDDPSNGPSVIIRVVEPFMAIVRGFSATAGASSQDPGAAIDTGAEAKDELYGITLPARQMDTSVFPVLKNLFFSGTGSRYEVDFSEWVRYNAMLLRAYQWMLIPVQTNYLTYHFDWSKVYPYSSDVPQWLYKLAAALDATDVGLASRWFPLLKRFDNKIMFPRIIEDFKRMASPMSSIDMNGRIQVPYTFDPFVTNADQIESEVDKYLTYLDTTLSKASALFQTYLPFPMLMSDPWNLALDSTIDVARDSGWFNSPVRNFPIFGDSGDPANGQALVFTPDDNNQIIYYSRQVQPTWSEVRLATIYKEDKQTLDDEYHQMTFHRMHKIILADDAGEFFAYDGSRKIEDTSTGWRYLEFANSRFAANESVKWGSMKPGFMGASIPLESVERLVKLDVDYAFSVDLLKQIMVGATGSSLRELRDIIRRTVASGVMGDT